MTIESLDNLTCMQVTIEQHIAHIQLCRPEKLNSMNAAFWQELPDVIRRLDSSAAARVIVISAQGKHFSSGMDLSVFAELGKLNGGEQARAGERMRQLVLQLQESFTALETCRIPVLAAVQGAAIGGAVDMLCACDSRYCSEDAYFSIKETPLGMTADVGTLQRLPSLISQGLARELAFTGRDFKADEAKQSGFVNQVFANQEQLLDGVMKIAAQIAANSPLAVAGSKEMLNYARDHSVADSLNYMATWQAGMFKFTDIQTTIQAQQSKQLPEYEDLHPLPNRL